MKKRYLLLTAALVIGIFGVCYLFRDKLNNLLPGRKGYSEPEDDIFDDFPEDSEDQIPAEEETYLKEGKPRRGYIRLKFHERTPEEV